MIIINVITSICFIGMLVLAFIFTCNLFNKSRADRLIYLQNFKNGKFLIIFFIALPLFWMGIVYSGEAIGKSFFLAIKSCADLVLLKFDVDSNQLLMQDNVFYRVTIDGCFALVIINAIALVISILGRRIFNAYLKTRNTIGRDKTYVIIGYNQANECIVKSIGKDKRCIMIFTGNNSAAETFAYVEKIAYHKVASYEEVNQALVSLFKGFDVKNVDVIINTEDDATNLTCVKLIADYIIDNDLVKYCSNDQVGLNAYVFSEPENISFFFHFEEKTGGCVHYVNKYKLLAMDFVDKYPLTQFLDDRYIDYSHGTVKSEVSFNVLMIGFGKTNQQIFLTSVANNQFLTCQDGQIKEKVVNYFIYDKKNAKNDKNLNHNYYRFSNELTGKDDEYLALPPKPANEKFFGYDINDIKFYESVKENLNLENKEHNCNYIIIAFGSDMQNLDLGEKLLSKIKEWGIDGCTKIFVKIRDGRLKNLVIDKEYIKDNSMFTFGNENEVVYSLNQIIDERIEKMAFNRHLVYKMQNKNMLSITEDEYLDARLSWFNQAQVQRQSNIYACLSIKSKLHLLGFDYCSINEDFPDASEEYMEVYQKNNPIVYLEQPAKNGYKTIIYSTDFVLDSVRGIMAVHEHQRWNAYMITCGFIPSTKKQIEEGSIKNFDERRHGNITTLEGLIEFRKMEVKRRNCSEIEADVIKYDYQLMDDLVWMLDKSGYKIIKRER